ncbi:Putative lipase/esterase [Xenorhabdus nematophila ATCC 19061]|uniref:Lipase/esterase n=1 Tax=Xenorhabdus nematophila (strain ATCC 19061 / DSM 3370 / CCUG 14189 / LMG 1036 / NCIMB 9965 / AN6) TaxID=406817 RepID=D3VBM0_XENNA|nr:alpha/beta hydrolase [Xenorhabdus nematophila]CBJ91859.1 Putative lipase/esterase [Xenorhabdus nematophila ATCC 19061]CEK24676.1 Putative lipase/esterase [Xenorhabdus nematophila AN6/1]
MRAKLTQSMKDYEYACSNVIASDFYNKDLDYVRSSYKALFSQFPPRPRDGTNSEDLQCKSSITGEPIDIRIYSPNRQTESKHVLPCIIYAHGGGFVSGDLSVVESMGEDLVLDLNVKVVTFNYRLAPEHPHPAALEDCCDVYLYIHKIAKQKGINLDQIYFAGESCGGSWSIALPLWLRDNKLPQLAGSIAINPVLDVHRWVQKKVRDSSQEFCDEMYFFTKSYLGQNENRLISYASPLRAENLSELPPAVFWAAIDPLSDDVTEMSTRMKQNGIEVYVNIEDEAIHGCLRARYYYLFAKRGYDNLLKLIMKLLNSQLKNQ